MSQLYVLADKNTYSKVKPHIFGMVEMKTMKTNISGIIVWVNLSGRLSSLNISGIFLPSSLV